MKVECIENKYNNGNFTLNKVYKIKDGMITCDFVHLSLADTKIEDSFEFAFCKFRVVK